MARIRRQGQIDREMDKFLEGYCRAVVRLYRGNITRAAKHAGRDRTTFYRMLWRLGILTRASEKGA